MTFEIGFLFAVLLGMVALFLTEKLPVDLTAFLGLTLLIFTGYIAPDEAFTGFASSAVITMLSIFIVSASLLNTGVADLVGGRIYRWVGGREIPLVVTVMVVAGVLSAFMNNIAATAVLMPAVASLGRRAGLAPSRLFMPLAFGAILGGTSTLIGTPPNILAAAMLEERGLEPFSLFDFTPFGIAILAVGVLYMATVGRRLLPSREIRQEGGEAGELTRLYGLNEALFAIRIPADSELDGATLGETRFGTALGVQIVAVVRHGERNLAPSADTRLRAGDQLEVQGDADRVRDLLRLQGLAVDRATARQLGAPGRGIEGIRLRISDQSALCGESLKSFGFRERLEVAVLAIERGDERFTRELADRVLAAGDLLIGIGASERVASLVERTDLGTLEERGIRALRGLRDEPLLVLRLPEGSPLVGATVAKNRVGELMGLTIVGIHRGDSIEWAVSPNLVLEAGDRLFVSGEEQRLRALLKIGNVDLETQVAAPNLESEEVGVVEATLAPRSSLAGCTLAEVDFRSRFGLQVLAIWRDGRAVKVRLARLALRVGDGLLLQGRRGQLARLSQEPDLVVLTDVLDAPRRLAKAPYAIGGLLLMIGLVVLKIQPIHVAAFTAASLVILSGALRMEEAYRAIEWRAIFLVAAVLPVGMAMEKSGAALMLAETVAGLAGPLGPYAVLASLVVLSSLLSQGLDGAPAVVLLTPVVLQTAESLGLSPYPLMMGVALAASAAFMTPFSHKANLLVMGLGGYRTADYLRVGTPLTVVLLALMTYTVPLLFPF